ncbi:MAG TPA: NAD(P)H-hydrate dehydratase [Cellvibrionaceae bacterium]|nr:NAD(P)H-hydrate dehydratase [Cellvibrionaceae bacterium]
MPALPQGLYPAAAVKAIDAAAIAAGTPGVVLMKRAARAALNLILARYPQAHLWIFCGGGNNGGDGYVLAGLAKSRGLQVSLFWAEDPAKLSREAADAYAFALQEQVEIQPASALPAQVPEQLLIVDALLGIGLTGEVRPATAALIQKLNQYRAPRLALDIPSGLCADTGRVLGAALQASLSLCFVALKPGLFTGSGPALCGEVLFDDLAIAPEFYPPAPITRVDAQTCAGLLPRRAADAHKGHSGHVLVVGGELGMGGAGLLCSEAALKVGAGLVSLATRAEHVLASQVRRPEIMAKAVNTAADLAGLTAKASVLALGPGLGQEPWGQQLHQSVLSSGKPLVLDADGLNLLARTTAGLSCPSPCIITPHPAEAARLLGITTEQVQADRLAAAANLAAKTQAVVVLKGAGTVIASGNQRFIAKVGNPVLATAGSGDVLCGLIAGLWAQGLAALDAALLGVCLHGALADALVAGNCHFGHSAGDLIGALPQVCAGWEAQ